MTTIIETAPPKVMWPRRDVLPNPDHPAKWSEPILERVQLLVDAEAARLGREARLIDPFAGVGRIHDLRRCETIGVEIEEEWAACRRDATFVGDATDLPEEWAEHFDLWCSSPCLAQHHRVLTDDLRWVPVGDVREGDQLIAFDESGVPGATGRNARRRWQRAEVVRSKPRVVECVRVILANGDEIVTTPEHPWLASRYAFHHPAEWVPSSMLLGGPGIGTTRGHRRGARQAYYVNHQVMPWEPLRSFEAGWLSGMFDGEGSLSLGAHGSPKLSICQVQGPTMDRAEELMARLGFDTNRITRKPHEKWQPADRQPVDNLYVVGGFPGLMRTLGQLRPGRLLDKWARLDLSTRTVDAEKVLVVAVEPAGRVDIQEIETSTGTYIGEGYLHHNCYGNRMRDHHNPKDSSTRHSYKFSLGHDPNPASAATLRWDSPAYRELHMGALREARRVVRKGGAVVVNMSNHYRQFVPQPVVEWWISALAECGLLVEQVVPIPTARMRKGRNGQSRYPYEHLIVTRRWT